MEELCKTDPEPRGMDVVEILMEENFHLKAQVESLQKELRDNQRSLGLMNSLVAAMDRELKEVRTNTSGLQVFKGETRE